MQLLQKILAGIDPSTLSRFFSHSAVERGRSYLSRVQQIQASQLSLTAKVQGSAYKPYVTTILFSSMTTDGFSSPFRSVHCTCPVGHFCKHAVALILAVKQSNVLEKPRQEVLEWACQLKDILTAPSTHRAKKAESLDSVLYALEFSSRKDGFSQLLLFKGRLSEKGYVKGKPQSWSSYERAIMKPPSFVRESDLSIFRLIYNFTQKSHFGIPLLKEEGKILLDAILKTGRCFLVNEDGMIVMDNPPLREGPPRTAKIIWQTGEWGTEPQMAIQPTVTHIVRLSPLHYFDEVTGEIGPVDFEQGPLAQRALESLLDLPALSELELPIVATALESITPLLASPISINAEPLPVLREKLVPVLRLLSIRTWMLKSHRKYTQSHFTQEYDYGLVRFCYGDIEIPIDSKLQLVNLSDGRYAKLERDEQTEATAIEVLKKVGFLPVHPSLISPMSSGSTLPDDAWGLDCEASWTHFFSDIAPILRDAGWKIDCNPDFRHNVLTVDTWQAELNGGEGGWFDLSLGIDVNGQQIELAPLLSSLFRLDGRWLDKASLNKIKNEELIELKTPEGLRIKTKAARIKPLASVLIDLFDDVSPTSPTLKVSQFDAPRLHHALKDWEGDALLPLQHWVKKIEGMKKLKAVTEPEGFGVTLRSYQLEGLAWLQHLCKHELGGILADDMGLGKTAQTLAHLLTEKREGRLKKPTLVVLPTSLIFNWQREAERFAPELKVLKLHGSERHDAFEKIPEYDVCLTTYPLLARDTEKLTAYDYYYLILDEAQTVKNAGSIAAQVVRQIKAQHKLCLTGTPLENHLGELWAQFDFLMPGFLGQSKDFARRWRTPIEKHGNVLRREALAQRLSPFILRRKKEEVAKELPPKTIVIRTIELEGAQRDLYETVRAAMDQRIQDEIAKKGFNRSQIIILDALLKLRQVCCDPRLLKKSAATKVKERAKLNQLMQMLPELVSEGRKVLVFSQFTSMLALIEPELKKEKIAYSLLTGDTLDREGAIRSFQEGNNPVFLISLKAGGVGLNLTAADTVIHFDPWWNPAVENQATDRAHRLGQTKNVFVYKLVVSGSIEEKILVLQEKKAELAASILSEDHEGGVKFSEADIQSLLAPLPEK